MIIPIAFGILLLLVSGGLFGWWYLHGKSSAAESDERVKKFLAEQSRRRFHVNGLVGICGLSFIVIPFLEPLGGSIVGLILLVVVIRMLHLAMVDVSRTQRFLLSNEMASLQEIKNMQQEIAKFHSEPGAERNGNGKAKESD